MMRGTARCRLRAAAFAAGILASSQVLPSEDGHEFIRLLGFELNTVTLDDIQHRLGAAPIVEDRTSPDHESSVCYVAGAMVARFLSAAPGGEVRELLGFAIADRAPDNSRNCAPLPVGAGPMQAGGLHPGMTRGAFSAAVGDNLHWEGDVVRRFFAVPPPTDSQKQGASRKTSVAIVARFAGDRLVEFKVWKLPAG